MKALIYTVTCFVFSFVFITKANAETSDYATCEYAATGNPNAKIIITLESGSPMPTATQVGIENAPTVMIVGAFSRSNFVGSDGAFGCPSYIKMNSTKSPLDGKPMLEVSIATAVDPDKLTVTKSIINGKDSSGNNGGQVINPITGEPINCSDFTYEEKDEAGKVIATENLINEIFNIFMIAAPILLIVFGSIDFAKATLASDEQAMKKAGTNFGKRAIAAVLLFILPLIISFIINVAFDAGIFGDKIPEVCIDK
jgi:large-conductance mechanosensitive channel